MKNIIITGTSRGIGYEMAQLFAKSGHNVLAISRKKSGILAEIDNITCLEIDLSDEFDFLKIANFLEKNWTNVDAIIHNAGSLIFKPFAETTNQDFENIYKTY